ncbi:MAG: DNA repair protein RecO [Anaerolineaceae bacterium]
MPDKENRTFRATAVVLRHVEYGEADRILTLFTLEKGKIQAIAKGVRKIRSRKAGHLEPFTKVALFLAKGRNLAIVTQAEALESYPGIRADLQRTALAAYVIELLDRFTQEEGENRQLFGLLVDTLGRLNQDEQPQTVVRYYEVQLLDLLGFRPELTRCVVCRAEIKPEDQFFSARLGGALCPRCSGQDTAAWRISVSALKYLRYFQRSPYSAVRVRVIPAAAEVELRALMERYFTYLLEYGLRTPGFLDAIS